MPQMPVVFYQEEHCGDRDDCAQFLPDRHLFTSNLSDLEARHEKQ
jgi:hypothetical protein